MRRFIALLLVIFLATMPLTAINGIVTLVHVTINQPADSARLLDVGGILGEAIYTMVENQPLLQKIISLKTLEKRNLHLGRMHQNHLVQSLCSVSNIQRWEATAGSWAVKRPRVATECCSPTRTFRIVESACGTKAT